jgi:hypothetical protein
MGDDRSEVTEATREAEAEEARSPHAVEPEDIEGEKSVDGHTVDTSVREHYREMTELGADDPGEGRIT